MIDLVAAGIVDIAMEPVTADQLIGGSPSTGYVDLGVLGDNDYGVWQMTPGAMRDTEADEVFIVLSGAATVRLLDDDTTIELTPGSVGRLTAGMRTIWTVTETLRKVYVTPS